jgi:taurine transport system substrate-binding protein
MRSATHHRISGLLALLSATVLFMAGTSFSHAQDKEVNIAYQLINGPYLVAIANGDFEKATGYKINWRQFDSGGKIATAMASGDIQIGALGSSPLASVISRGVDLQLFGILDLINEAEALVVRNGSGINKPEDLRGKKIGVPFVSTTHYHLLYALELWGISPGSVEILNMQPNQIAAAWARGDIDAGYAWGPAQARIKETGKVLIDSGELGRKGKITFDGFAVARKFAEANPDFMAKFVKVATDADAAYRNNPAAWTPDSPMVKANVKMIGGQAKDVVQEVAGYGYPTREELISPAWLGGDEKSGAAKALKDTAEFLKAQGKIDQVYPDYSKFVTTKYVEAAMKLK